MKIRENSLSWINREIIEELYYKDNLYCYARVTGKEDYWKHLAAQNKRAKRLILEAKEDYTKDFLEQYQGNPRNSRSRDI